MAASRNDVILCRRFNGFRYCTFDHSFLFLNFFLPDFHFLQPYSVLFHIFSFNFPSTFFFNSLSFASRWLFLYTFFSLFYLLTRIFETHSCYFQIYIALTERRSFKLMFSVLVCIISQVFDHDFFSYSFLKYVNRKLSKTI